MITSDISAWSSANGTVYQRGPDQVPLDPGSMTRPYDSSPDWAVPRFATSRDFENDYVTIRRGHPGCQSVDPLVRLPFTGRTWYAIHRNLWGPFPYVTLSWDEVVALTMVMVREDDGGISYHLGEGVQVRGGFRDEFLAYAFAYHFTDLRPLPPSVDPLLVAVGIFSRVHPRDLRFYAVRYGEIASGSWTSPVCNWIGVDEAQWREFLYNPERLITNITAGLDEALAWLASDDNRGMRIRSELSQLEDRISFLARVQRACQDWTRVIDPVRRGEPDSTEEQTGEESGADSV